MICTKCGKDRPETEFSLRSSRRAKRQYVCKTCKKAYSRDHYERNKAKYIARAKKRNAEVRVRNKEIIRRAKVACLYCGEDHPATLDFHHRDPDDKLFNISTAKDCSEQMLRDEIAQCDVLCANCHRKLHFPAP